MLSKLRKTTAVLALCLIFSCGDKPSVDDAKKALNDVFGKIGKVENVEKLNGWFEDNNNRYVMEVKYEIELDKEGKKELKSASKNVFAALMMQPILQICSKNGKLSDTCEGKAKLVFRKTEKGWTIIDNKSQYVE